jgi:hypothetical protein
MKAEPPTLFGVYVMHHNAALRARSRYHDARASRWTKRDYANEFDLHKNCCEAIAPYLKPDELDRLLPLGSIV